MVGGSSKMKIPGPISLRTERGPRYFGHQLAGTPDPFAALSRTVQSSTKAIP